MITRRHALAGASALAASFAGLPRPALAQQSGQVVVGTWGGDYAELLRQNIDEPILKPTGLEVLQDVANADARKTKLLAERQNRRGAMDVACLSDTEMDLMAKQGIFEAIPEGQIARLSKVIPALRKSHAIPHIYSYRVILYNPDKVTVPPKSYADLWDSKWRGRVGFSDILYAANMDSASLAAGKPNDIEAAKQKMLELKPLDPKIYPSNEALAAALKSEEVWLTVMWLARGFMWQKAGIPLKHVVPAEGATTIVFEAAVPKNARSKDNAWRYLNGMLQPDAQIAFADKMGYAPTVVDARLPDELQSRISLSEGDKGRLLVPDYEYLRGAQPQMLDFWNKQFKA